MERIKNQILKISHNPFAGLRAEVGASTIFLLGFLPLLCGLLFGVMAVLVATQAKMIPLQTCRQGNLKLQTEAEKSILSLLQLNPVVTGLRLEKKAAAAALAAATVTGNPFGIAQAEKALLETQASLRNLKLQQLRILTQQDASSLKAQSESQRNAHRELAELSRSISFFLKLQLQNFSSPLHQVAVKPDIETDEAAIYEREISFSEKQISHSFWKLKLSIDQQHWLSHFFHNEFTWKGSCKASLFTEHSQWIPGLLQ